MTANPPVSEVAYSAQCPNVMGLTVLDMANFYERFKDRFPVLQQVQELMPITIENQAIPPFQIGVPGAVELPRIWCISSDSRRLIQLQRGRFSFNWRRVLPDDAAEYPGYDALRAEWEGLLIEFHTWCRERLDITPTYDIGELMYVNTVPFERGDGQPDRRISEIFKFYRHSGEKRRINGFNVGWAEPIEGDPPGRVSVQCFIGAAPDGKPAAITHFVTRVKLTDSQQNPGEWFHAAHRKILDLFEFVITSSGEDAG